MYVSHSVDISFESTLIVFVLQLHRKHLKLQMKVLADYHYKVR